MKKFTILFCLILVQKMFCQVTGVTVYTSSYSGYGGSRQPVAQAPNGDIYFNSNAGDLVRFSGGSFSSAIAQFGFGMNLFATVSGVWLYDEWGTFGFFNGNTFTDYSASISGLIGTVTPSNPINYLGTQGSNVLIATNQGIIKFNGQNFSLINTGNSNLVCDTVNCITDNGNTTYIGTCKGLYTFNGNTFSAIIPLSGASDQNIEHVFSNGPKTIVTRKDTNPNICFNYFELSGNQCNRLGAFVDSASYKSSYNQMGAFVSSNIIMNNSNYIGNGNCRLYASLSSYTTFLIPGFSSYNSSPLSYPGNQQKFYYASYGNNIQVAEIDIPSYSNCGTLFTPDEFKYLDTNQVMALIGVNSLKFEAYENPGIFPAGYRVPKTGSAECGGGSSLWIGGLDKSGLLHVAGETYRQNGQDFWPGPLDTTNAQASNITNAPFNQVWKISCNQINQFAANANANNFAANTSTVFADINSFIANGNNNFERQLAPFYDKNNNGIYEPGIGEYPVIRGHQQIYSIYNDNFSPHTETHGMPLGVEVHERSFAYNVPGLPDSMQVVNYSTFYNYEIVNRSNNNYNNVYMTIWNDTDLGYYLNDYVGTDTLNQFGYMYNATITDPTYNGVNGFENKLPMFAYALLPRVQNETDGVDNNNNGQIDESGERFKLNLTTYYNNNIGAYPPPMTNPDTKWDYYKYMSGRWKDSTQFKPLGNAYNPTLNIAPTNYVYNGNPQTFSGWTEATASVTPGDRRILCTIGPFNFPAKKKVEFEYAYVFSRDTSLNNVNNNFSLLQKDVRNVKYFMSQQPASCMPIVNGIKENSPGNALWIYPNPFKDDIIINLDHNTKFTDIKIYDLTGRVMLQSSMQNTYTKTLDLNSLSQGIYLIELSDGKSKAVKKIVKN